MKSPASKFPISTRFSSKLSCGVTSECDSVAVLVGVNYVEVKLPSGSFMAFASEIDV